jgi:hypothetical protein
MGTNIDAIKVGSRIGIDEETCINFANTQDNCATVIQTASAQVSKLRGGSAAVFNDKENLKKFVAFSNQQRTSCSTVKKT